MPGRKRREPEAAPPPAGPTPETLSRFPVGARVVVLPSSAWWDWWRAGVVVGYTEAGDVRVRPDGWPGSVTFEVPPAHLSPAPEHVSKHAADAA